MKREEFLSRAGDAAAAGRAYRVHLRHDLPPDAGYAGAGPDPLERLATEIDAVGGHAHLVADRRGARDALVTILDQYRVTSAIAWRHRVLDELEIKPLLAGRGVRYSDYDDLAALDESERHRVLLAADLGVSSVTYAIAETGTLAVASAPGQERSVSLLPPVHVALVTKEQVLPDLFDLFERTAAAGLESLASNLTLITGPSKTGDVELKLTTGVHGPKEWHVIIVP